MLNWLPSRSRNRGRFSARYGVDISTIENPNIVTSNWAYFKVSTGTAYTVPADTAITFDGSTWITTNGNTPAGAKRWKCRIAASTDYETAVTKTPVLGGVDYPFTVTTGSDLSFGPTWEDASTWDDNKTWTES